MKRFIIIFSCLFCLIGANAFAEGAQEQYDKAKKCYDDLKLDIHKINDANYWHACIAEFKRVPEQHPQSPKAAPALYSAAKMHRELYGRTKNNEEAKEAIHLYNAVVRDYPKSNLADDALYQIGLLRHDPFQDDDKARKAFIALIERYPDGDMAGKAKTALNSLGAAESITEVDVEATKKTPAVANASSSEKPSRFSLKKGDSYRLSELISYDVKTTAGQTVVTLNMDQETSFTREYIDFGRRTRSPAKLNLFFPRTKVAENIKSSENISSPHLQSIKVKHGIFSGETKIYFELEQGASYKITQNGRQTIINFFKEGDEPALPKTDKKTTNQDITGKKKLRIVIDPGHGGDDTGAIGPDGTKEKDVTLAIAKETANVLKKKLNAQVFLTRTRDVTLPLEKRNKFANAKKADIFISIHANAVSNRKISGIETYYLNNATDEAAKRLASRENMSAAKSQDQVEKILLTLFQNFNTEESRVLAKDVHNAMIERIGKNYPNVKNRHVRSALFYLLVGAKCPGILMEVAYISNPTEEKRLKSRGYKSQVAYAIADGVKSFADSEMALASNFD